MVGYCGCATTPNRAFWVCFAIFFFVGKLMLIVGFAKFIPCNKRYNRCTGDTCRDQLDECGAHWLVVLIIGLIFVFVSTIPLCYFWRCAEPPASPPKPTNALLPPQVANASRKVHPVAAVAWQPPTATAIGSGVAQPGQPYLGYPPAAAPTGSQPYPAYAAPAVPPQGPVYPPYAGQQQGQPQQSALTPSYTPAQPAPSAQSAAPPPTTTDVL